MKTKEKKKNQNNYLLTFLHERSAAGTSTPVAVSPEEARLAVSNWLKLAPLWQRLWEPGDIETESRTKKGDRKPLLRPAPDNSDKRLVLTIPGDASFTPTHVKELIRALMADDSKRLSLEGLKARSNAIGDAGLVELTTLLETDPISGQPFFPNFKKLVLLQDFQQITSAPIDSWKRDCTGDFI